MTEIDLLTTINDNIITLTPMVQGLIEILSLIGGLLAALVLSVTWKG